ncbi:hypothetical protein O181_022379 [Austropuccinia psidii MF-1]|uniref:Chromo domain-containing protein n=1 Tax=Austropuccinia psidii MF-1 TaxID=1389203 RepID=A0A9Q3GXL7_9BASI|nr:hypothetical protein [Austropuccinia psidii MF-1]
MHLKEASGTSSYNHMEEEEEWKFSQVLNSKLERGKLCCLVEWKSFSKYPERATWEPIESLRDCPELVKDFHQLYPEKQKQDYSRGQFIMVLGEERNL